MHDVNDYHLKQLKRVVCDSRKSQNLKLAVFSLTVNPSIHQLQWKKQLQTTRTAIKLVLNIQVYQQVAAQDI